ncbi:PAS-domain containing protein [Loktanella sp. 3ANDIMAR09]|uniref:PAS-domain containing protein n=1 Tax=Loktanella sp. 3ANDIMAR09 TaxID=1225657 RepID=UPI000AA7E4BE|nr:PAS-domain containing protein [Loktanella sp. 3ANDIMAR09]
MIYDSILLFVAACLCVAGLTAAFIFARSTSGSASAPPRSNTITQTPVFLFDRDILIDASPSGSALIGDHRDKLGDLGALLHVLGDQFPTLQDTLGDLGWNDNRQVPAGQDDTICIQIRNENGLTRISLAAAEAEQASARFAAMEHAIQNKELTQLRDILRETPQLVWQEDARGELIWANAAYLTYAERTRPDTPGAGRIWPGQRLFGDISVPDSGCRAPNARRLSLQLHGEEAEHWFDITSCPLPGSTLFFATDANATMRAESELQGFRQTLVKTFAELSTGLAIFDRDRKLTMFNPAFVDMFGLPIQFVTVRPTLESVLDRLREMRKLPEPKDYPGWREQFAALDAVATDGAYSDRWDLPDGQVFRVTGRPHPDGAIAILFEDISAEVSLTRRFRVEIETGQAVLDTLSDAIAVFSDASTLVMTNSAYTQMWGDHDTGSFDLQDLRTALRLWKSHSAPTDFWRKVEKFGQLGQRREVVTDDIILVNGRRLRCEAHPIPAGMTMVKFLPADGQPPMGCVTQTPRTKQRVASG